MELRAPLFDSVMHHRSNSRGHIINAIVTVTVTVTGLWITIPEAIKLAEDWNMWRNTG